MFISQCKTLELHQTTNHWEKANVKAIFSLWSLSLLNVNIELILYEAVWSYVCLALPLMFTFTSMWTHLKTHSQQEKAKANEKNFFDVCHFSYRFHFSLIFFTRCEWTSSVNDVTSWLLPTQKGFTSIQSRSRSNYSWAAKLIVTHWFPSHIEWTDWRHQDRRRVSYPPFRM